MPPAQDDKPYRLIRPEKVTTGVVFSSPHSGREYPADLRGRSGLDSRRLRSSEDAYVDRLLAPAPEAGAPVLTARFPRAWVDLNRAEDELDPALIEGLPRGPRGPRVMAGLGVIPRVVAGNRAIYSGKITRAEAEARIAGIWRPWHIALAGLVGEARRRFGRAVLFDVHSMPSEAIDQMGARRPDIVLGDRYGASSRADTTAAVDAVFAGLGLRVARNNPFAGAYITQRYGRPAEGIDVVQIEINRGLYLDEAAVAPSADYEAFAALMARAVAGLAEIGRAQGRMAAE
ncbi:N-formylglutamate amidohydrolase [Paenirhodobacter sp.]|uniref:N-formylglutamate amidohydrolase n=1 Tax=Paenirhodobacter sp. TaxID=1965326 RepID=UPI003B4005E7